MAIDPRPLTLLLGRFEDLVARGLRSLVADDPTIDVLARDVAPEVFADAIAEHKPGVAVVNFGSLTSPFEVHELAKRYPDTHLIVLANRPTQVECTQLLAFGATACLSKETQGRDILNAIHLASRGMQLLPRSARMSTAALAGPELLTAREADVLALLQSGSSNAQIAGELHVSVETVRTHARNIYRKLGVRTRRELAHR